MMRDQHQSEGNEPVVAHVGPEMEDGIEKAQMDDAGEECGYRQ